MNSRSGASGAGMKHVRYMHVPKKNKMTGTVSQERVKQYFVPGCGIAKNFLMT